MTSGRSTASLARWPYPNSPDYLGPSATECPATIPSLDLFSRAQQSSLRTCPATKVKAALLDRHQWQRRYRLLPTRARSRPELRKSVPQRRAAHSVSARRLMRRDARGGNVGFGGQARASPSGESMAVAETGKLAKVRLLLEWARF